MNKNLPATPDRRTFLKTGGVAAAALLTKGAIAAQTAHTLPPLPVNARTRTAMPTRNLGNTGYKVGIFSLGGQGSLEKPANFDVAVPIIVWFCRRLNRDRSIVV